MVELPRDPIDERIDTLSDMALHMLLVNGFGDMKPHELYDIETAEELVEIGMLKPYGADESLPQLFEATVSGALASERLRCGIYHKHKALYEARERRDREMESIPGYATF